MSFNAHVEELKRKIEHNSTGMPPHASVSSEDFDKLLRSSSLLTAVTPTISRLLTLLSSFIAATQLPSRSKPGSKLHIDILDFLPDLSSNRQHLEIGAIATLLSTFIHEATDEDIWSAVYGVLTPVTPPTTPCATISSVLDTPIRFSTGSLHNTSESRSYMDEVIKNEIADHIYMGLPDFFNKFFHSVDGLQSLAEAVFTKCRQTGSYTQGQAERWRSFPATCRESEVVTWFREEVEALAQFALEETQDTEHAARLASRRVISRGDHPLPGSTAPRKLDIGFSIFKGQGDVETTPAGNQGTVECTWEEILVPGELKGGQSRDPKSITWCDLARYVREVYAAQDTRRFSHGFTLCGDVMRVWRFDRGAIYAAPPFSVNQDGQRFVMVVLGYLLMREEELGYDTTICKDGGKQYISVVRNGKEERFLIDQVMHRQSSIIGRGTTCWKVTLKGSNEKFVIKDSWQYEGKVDEGELLKEITKKSVQNVAHCYHSEIVRIGDMNDDLHGNVRKEINLYSGKKLKPRQNHLTTALSKTTSSNSTLRKRVAPTTLESSIRKKSRSNSEGGNGNGSALNRFHKRIIMSRCGKPLYMAGTRIGVLKGLIGAISGHQNLFRNKILHRDISIGNVLLSEDETEGFLIDLDHAIRLGRKENSGARGRTGTKVFMSIGLLLQGYEPNKKPHSFMDDLESFFWLLFWICVHYSGPGGEGVRKATNYEDWNYRALEKLGNDKVGFITDEQDFLTRINADFSDYFAPLVPWVNRLRREVFPGGLRWKEEDRTLYERMKDVLHRAMKDPAVMAEWPEGEEMGQTY
ncbi:hypothetical protein EX30DRAFT_375391 [Ascodesmis nigricans]|uniref:EKC/KEOPS complex subunit BUD32 n=1 Tax=Ascodesmis nigricans TaxID=341454 RepID=A0A4S2MQH2_9PEZI|nr:hypothetical protein EX30DRAFT_375391 [Ascodesmis nigricans]